MKRKNKNRNYRVNLSQQHTTKLVQLRAPVSITASAEGEGGPKAFAATAYSGGLVPGYTSSPPMPHPYVIDLSGMSNSRNVIANLDHEAHQRVGHLTAIENDKKQLHVEGLLSAATPYRDEVANSTKDGMPWEVSIEGNLSSRVKLSAGDEAIVNGQAVRGPAFIFRKSQFTGIAFVSQGADDGNNVTIAASTAGEQKMLTEFEKYVVRCGADPEAINDDQRKELQKSYEAVLELEKKPKSHAQTSFNQRAEEIRMEQERCDKIADMALGFMRGRPIHIQEKIQELADAAIESKTEPNDFELTVHRGLLVGSGDLRNISGRNSDMNDPVMLEAAICMSAGMPEPSLLKNFSQDTLNAVDRSELRHFSLQQFLLRVAHSNGYRTSMGQRIHNGNLREILEYCFPPAMARTRLSGFSAVDLPNILGNVANKEILSGYMEEDTTWMEIADVKSVNNFHAVTSYRMLDNLEYEELGPTGQIKHGTLGEESYTRQAKTYAKMLGLTRNDIINDDLGAFDDIRTRLGRGAAKKFNDIFWAAFMNNATFFTTALTNYIEGANTPLDINGTGLQLGITAYRQMTTPSADGSKRIGVSAGSPRKLLVPPQLEFIAQRLFQSTTVNTGGSSSNDTVGNANIHAGRYRPIVQDRLSDSSFTGNSATAWYLFGDMMNPMVVSFLFGNRTPTVESSEADFDQLGILFRGYHDFGCDKAEYLAGIKSKGAS